MGPRSRGHRANAKANGRNRGPPENISWPIERQTKYGTIASMVPRKDIVSLRFRIQMCPRNTRVDQTMTLTVADNRRVHLCHPAGAKVNIAPAINARPPWNQNVSLNIGWLICPAANKVRCLLDLAACADRPEWPEWSGVDSTA